MESVEFEPLITGGVVSSLQDQVNDSTKRNISEDELFKKVEDHLMEKIHNGDKEAPFLLGQFYYEEVGKNSDFTLMLIVVIVE